MEIQHFNDAKKGHFRAVDGTTEAGIMTYVWEKEDTFVIEHTVGNPDFKGVGLKMLDRAVAYARAHGKKILPRCTFAKKMFDRMPEIRDVLSD